jgi:hypothetical protein
MMRIANQGNGGVTFEAVFRGIKGRMVRPLSPVKTVVHMPVNHRPTNRNRLAKSHRKSKGAPANAEIRFRTPKKSRSTQASAITNGRLLPSNVNGGVDGRSAWVRRVRDLIAQHTADLGSDISCAEQALVRRCATLCCELERRELFFAQTASIDDTALAVYQSGVNTLRRTLESLGLKRRARDVTPSLSDILRADAAGQRERQAEDGSSSSRVEIEHEDSS